jgi:abortive infection bacteriophage resistance protein
MNPNMTIQLTNTRWGEQAYPNLHYCLGSQRSLGFWFVISLVFWHAIHRQKPDRPKYGLANDETLAKWLRSLNFIRNVSAHHSRLCI